MCCGHQSISGANISIKSDNSTLKFTEFILKFTENDSQIHRKRKKAAAQGRKRGEKVILVNGNFREFVLHLAAGSDKGIKKDAGEVAVYHFGIFGYLQ